MNVEIKNIKISLGNSDETYCFNADIYADGKKVGYAKNNGRGGNTDYNRYPKFSYDDIRDIENYFKSMPCKEYTLNNEIFKMNYSLENFIDEAVEKKLAERDAARLKNRMEKDFQKYICYKVENGWNSTGWKNYTITQMLGTPVGMSLIQKTVDTLKEKGEKILNNNLIGIKL